MWHLDSITSKAVVWLGAILVPVASWPSTSCTCGSHVGGSATFKHAQVGADVATTCPHCTPDPQPRHSCCGGGAVASAPRRTCCGSSDACRCCGSRSPCGVCQCSNSQSVPAPAPLPNDPRPNDSKTPAISLGVGLASVAALFLPTAATCADHRPVNLGASAPERLSILCRLLI